MTFRAVSKMEAALLDTCCLVGSRATAEEIEAFLSHPGLHYDWLTRTLATHKAFTFFNETVNAAARRLPASEPLANGLRAIERDLSHCNEHLDQVIKEANTLAAASEQTSLVFIKGLSNARFYTTSGVRWTKDVDLFVPEWSSLMTLIHSLLDRGYVFDGGECPWLKADRRHGRTEYGQFSLIKSDTGDVVRFDIHLGTYSVSFNQYLRLPLMEFIERGPKGAVLDKTASLLVMFAHALSDGYVSVKDVNDAAAMATSEGDVDWRRLSTEIAAHKLQPQARVLADQLLKSYDDPDVRSFATHLSADRRPKRLFGWQMHNRNWRRRALVNTVYTYRATNSQNPVQAPLRALQCYAFYVRRLSIRIAPRSASGLALLMFAPKARLADWALRPDACLMLVPAWHDAVKEHVSGAAPASRQLQSRHVGPDGVRLVVDGKTGVALRIGQATFLPTWDLVIDRRQVQALAAAVSEDTPHDGR